jgi:hypothetical protein
MNNHNGLKIFQTQLNFEVILQRILFSFLIILFILISGCVPTEKANSSRKSSSSSTAKDGTTTKDAAPTATQSSSMFWFTNTVINGDAITLNLNTQNVIYLRGSSIQTFLESKDKNGLENFNKVYCLVATYDHNVFVTAKKQLRARAIPIVFNNFSTGAKERLFRIDIPDASSNQAVCQGTVAAYRRAPELDAIPVNATTAEAAFSPAQFCSNCTSIIPSKFVNLYVATLSGSSYSIKELDVVPKTLLNVSALGVRIDTISGASSGDSLCSISSCQAKGFDCCLEGQCVDDGSRKPNASTHPDFSQATADVAVNPLNFSNWPNIYYICTLAQPSNTTPNPGPDPSIAANATFERLKREFFCLEEAKKETPDFGVGACSKSTHTSKLSCEANGTCSNSTFTTQATCITNGKIWTPYVWTYHCGPAGDQTSYLTIRSDVWLRCGCAAQPLPTEPDDPSCPDFGLKAKYDTGGNITEVLCLNPQPELDPLPFQNLSLTVPARSAPHRFYLSQTGLSIDDVAKENFSTLIPGQTPVQEGLNFSYTDEAGKLEPQNAGPFNINAIVGQMDISLGRARPAIKVGVEIDTTYVISTIKGFYNPCPQCARDSWFDAFSSHPPSTQGRGLEPIGHTTFRDNYLTNITLGNYEDTHFGRACYLPPTMIPFTHRTFGSTIQEQRKARLNAQSALFVNGYQRDWYGFNKGALIGSFDGVRWFAIGTGRKVRATTSKLFLAINQPFADLAEPTDLVVSITTDIIGADVAAVHDYDPSLTDNSSYKNTGASCQEYHQCNNDGDCVTQLGWEYMCANVTANKTYLPVFDTNGIETTEQASVSGFSKLLQGGMPPGTTKRCIYRGMGAPCKVAPFTGHIYSNDLVTPNNDYSRIKNFTCAPGFWCAALNSSSFNDQVVREPNNLFAILFGQEASVLGRPLNYINANRSFTADIRDNILKNMQLYSTGAKADEWGLCRPGKTTGAANYIDQHKAKDTSFRMDYISQVGGCNPDISGVNRVRSCPVLDMNKFDSDGIKSNKAYRNYIFPSGTTATDNNGFLRRNQNMCGRSAKNSSGTSGFTDFELPGLINTIVQPSLVENACLRRAGSLCHSSLECGPGPLHKTAAERLSTVFFGNSLAEKQYWEEDLICGQQDPAPFLTAKTFSTYDLKQNLCCREVGKTITMYTSSRAADKPLLNSLDTTEMVSTFQTNRLTSDNSATEGRYSRYEIVAPLTAKSTADTSPQGLRFERPHFDKSFAPQPDFQWRTIHETGRRTCCGSGFIRKFADGTHDWRVRDRLKLNPANFACLNMRNDLPLIESQPGLEADYLAADTVGTGLFSQKINYENDVDFMCYTPFDGTNPNNTDFGKGRGCASIPFAETEGFNIVRPAAYADTASSRVTVQFFPQNNYWDGGGSGSGGGSNGPMRRANQVFPEAPFMALPYAYESPTTSATLIQQANDQGLETFPWAFESTELGLLGFGFYLPSYITVLDSRIVPEIRIRYFCMQGGCQYAFALSTRSSDISTQPAHELTLVRRTLTAGEIDNMPVCTTPNFMPVLDPAIPSPAADRAAMLLKVNADDLTGVCQYLHNDRIVIAVSLHTVLPDNPDPAFPWVWAGAEVDFVPANSRNYGYGSARAPNADREAVKPGNSLYYLSKLGRLELLGIPQIGYSPLYCSSNRERLVPGIFDVGGDTRTQFELNDVTLNSSINGHGNDERKYSSSVSGNDESLRATNGASEVHSVVYKDKIAPNDIFSENEFQCCIKLGQLSDSDDQCCSGFSVPDTTDPTKRFCKLPRGANLNVYFNRFVSSDGMLDDIPTTETKRVGFKEDHFIGETGEIKMSDEAYNVLVELGKKHCRDGTVAQGAAFGNYNGEPNRLFFNGADTDFDDAPTNDPENLVIFGIVDSPKDFDTTGDHPAGYQHFTAGFRWNHHYYCGLPQQGP